MLNEFCVCFIEQQNTEDSAAVRERVYRLVAMLTKEKEYVKLSVRKNSFFDKAVKAAVARMKKEVSGVESSHVWVISYRGNEGSTFGQAEAFSDVCKTIDRSPLCVFYAEKGSMAYSALEYARRSGKDIINFSEAE